MSLGLSLQLQVAESWFRSQEWVPWMRQRRCWTYPRGGKCFLRLEGTGGWGQGCVELSAESHVADPGPESGGEGPARA